LCPFQWIRGGNKLSKDPRRDLSFQKTQYLHCEQHFVIVIISVALVAAKDAICSKLRVVGGSVGPRKMAEQGLPPSFSHFGFPLKKYTCGLR
jgi:hypothetical protein